MDKELDFFAEEHALLGYHGMVPFEESVLDEFEDLFHQQMTFSTRQTTRKVPQIPRKLPKETKLTFEKETGITLNPLSSRKQDRLEDVIEDSASNVNDTSNIDSLVTRERYKKPGHQKNLPQSVYSQAIKRFLSPACRNRVLRLLRKEGLNQPDEHQRAFQYFEEKTCWRVSLKDLYHTLDGGQGNNEESRFKRSFAKFFQWYLHRWYPIYLVKQDTQRISSERKEEFLTDKNKLVYLPELNESKLQKLSALKESPQS